MRLYNKYRPRNFDDIDGRWEKEVIKGIIRNKSYQFRREYIFYSNDIGGVGKTTTALIMAKAIFCENNTSGNPCGKCKHCIEFDNGEYKDFKQINGADYATVDKVKTVIEFSKQYPLVKDGYRVIIIDEVQRMSPQAMTEFLDPLEFSDNRTIFIMTTTNLDRVPQPIVSRTLNIGFSPLSDNDIVSKLAYICKKENVEFDNEALRQIAVTVNGSMREAISKLEKYIISYGSVKNNFIYNNITDFAMHIVKCIMYDDDVQYDNLYRFDNSIVKVIPKIINSIIGKNSIFTESQLKMIKSVINEQVAYAIAQHYLKYKPSDIGELILVLKMIDFSRYISFDKKGHFPLSENDNRYISIPEERETKESTRETQENIYTEENIENRMLEYGFKRI